jgi:predicted hotdog family 3-hydroxylacyl-ACP dehydratase
MGLSRAAIAALIPHQGAMCLLEEVLYTDEDAIVCRAVSHRDAGHPLRDEDILPAVCGIEYAAQAMAVHGALMEKALEKAVEKVTDNQCGNARGRGGMLAAARNVVFNVERLDDIADDLIVSARKLLAEDGRLLYEFSLHAGGRELVRGRASVVLAAGRS